MELAVVGWVLRLFTTGCGVQEFVLKVSLQSLEIQKFLKKFFFSLHLVHFWPHGRLILSVLLRHR